MYNSDIARLPPEPIQIGDLVYDANQQSLSCSGETVYLRSKLNQVLFYMVMRNQHVVSREELIQKVWHGNYYTGVKGVTHSVCKLRKTFVELGAHNVDILTFPKQGYSLRLN